MRKPSEILLGYLETFGLWLPLTLGSLSNDDTDSDAGGNENESNKNNNHNNNHYNKKSNQIFY